MRNSFLSIKIVYDSLEETLKVLQGTSRYTNAIYLPKKLVLKEKIDVLNFLISRYPTKKIILDLSDHFKFDRFFIDVVRESPIQNFVISGSSFSKIFVEMCQEIKKQKKKVIWMTDEIDLNFFHEYALDAIYYFKKENHDDSNQWNKKDLEFIQKLYQNDVYSIVGEVLQDDIPFFKDIIVNEFVISEVVCTSFNPVDTCKKIYFAIKENFKNSNKNE